MLDRIRIIRALIGLCAMISMHIGMCAQNVSIDRIDPPHWWVGWDAAQSALLDVELLVEGDGLDSASLSIRADGVTMVSSKPAGDPRYRYVRLLISDTAKAQSVVITAARQNLRATYGFELRERAAAKHQPMGLSPSDVLYLITPDRFANGDPSNDVNSSMLESSTDRSNPLARHGGDLAGIQQHIDHIDSLGATAVWLSPVLENNMPLSSYHGYAITDHYRIDPRFGSLIDYRLLAQTLHGHGMRLVMDVVFNHVGSHHRLYRRPPDSAWFNVWPSYTQSNGRASTIMDPNAIWADRERMLRGWFDTVMPDVNQEYGHAALYMFQHVIWWIEEVGIDALRIDTYPFIDMFFMRDVCRTLRTMYPTLGIVGEVWTDDAVTQATFADRRGDGAERTWLPSLTDFQLYASWLEAQTSASGWNTGVGRLYTTLSADRLYDKPSNLMIFLDNHDVGRYFGMVKGNVQKFTQGITMLFTMRGIPCLYYGTEFLFRETDGHGRIRQDVAGGWDGDTRNLFRAEDRPADVTAAISLIQRLTSFRSATSAVTSGTFKHLIPQDGVYAYARFDQASTVLVVFNTDAVDRTFDWSRFGDIVPASGSAVDVFTGQSVDILKPSLIKPNGTVLIQIVTP
jgi:glycosidase